METWLWVERQAHLEASVEVEDSDQRERHRTIAKWLKHLLTVGKEMVIEVERSYREPDVSPEETGPYMEPDSGTYDAAG